MIGPEVKYRVDRDSKVFDDWIPRERIETREEAEAHYLSSLIVDSRDICVVDSYEANTCFQSSLHEKKVRWAQFALSSPSIYFADLVIAPSPKPYYYPEDYILVKRGAKLLSGLKYSIVRDEFTTCDGRKVNEVVTQILVCFGGGDDKSMLMMLAREITCFFPDILFHFICGPGFMGLEQLRNYCNGRGVANIKIHDNPSSMNVIYNSCDLAILGAGTCSSEAALKGLPMILVCMADNQLATARYFQEIGAAEYYGRVSDFNAKAFISLLKRVVDSRSERLLLSKKAGQTVDVHGADRICKQIEELVRQ